MISSRASSLSCVALAGAFAAAVAWGQAGELDPSFGGGDGWAVLDLSGAADAANAISVGPDGRIYAAGFLGSTPGDAAIVRWTTLGLPDPTFDGDGVARLELPTADALRCLAFRASGTVLAGGSAHGEQLLLERTSAGSPGSSFSGAGHLVFSYEEHGGFVEAIGVRSDGKFVAIGRSTVSLPDGSGEHVFVARFRPGGLPDPTFDGDGHRILELVSPWVAAIPELGDGRMLLAATHEQGFQVLRLLEDGALDPTFGDGGRTIVPWTADEIREPNLALHPDGRIVLEAQLLDLDHEVPYSDIGLARMSGEGELDPGFGEQGVAVVDLHDIDRAHALAVHGEAILVAGQAFDETDPGVYEYHGFVLRLDAQGDPDPTFGAGGLVHLDRNEDEGIFLRAIAVQPDGKAVVAGSIESENGADFYLARLLAQELVFYDGLESGDASAWSDKLEN